MHVHIPCIYHAYAHTSRHRTAPQISLPLLPLIPNAIATDAPRKEKAGDGEEEEADVPDEKAPLLYLLWLYSSRPYLLWPYLLWP